MAASATETELKFRLGPGAVVRLSGHPALQGEQTSQSLRSVYFDTADWRLQTSFEPTYRSCRSLGRFDPNTAYQVGFDGLWEREF